MNKVLKDQRGTFNIVELMIAVVLSSLVVIAVAAINTSAQRFFKSAKLQSQIQGETVFTVERVLRDVQLSSSAALSTVGGSGLTDDQLTLMINPPSGDASDPTDDTTVIYRTGSWAADIDGEMLYTIERSHQPAAASATVEEIARDLAFLRFYLNPDDNFITVTVTIKARTPGAAEMEYITFTSGAMLRERRAGT